MKTATPALERFDRHWSEDADGCHIWHGNTGGSKGRRPYFRATTRAEDPKPLAYRWLYEQVIGAILPGMEIHHLCDKALCVNVECLVPVTPAENARLTQLDRCGRGHDLTDPVNQRRDSKGRRRGCAQCGRDHALAAINRKRGQ